MTALDINVWVTRARRGRSAIAAWFRRSQLGPANTYCACP